MCVRVACGCDVLVS
uniref:Uncharacterized protein n=1 Tax=Arundo donax TaxID=35708 RepID=A0A0A9GHP5_ARUDO